VVFIVIFLPGWAYIFYGYFFFFSQVRYEEVLDSYWVILKVGRLIGLLASTARDSLRVRASLINRKRLLRAGFLIKAKTAGRKLDMQFLKRRQ